MDTGYSVHNMESLSVPILVSVPHAGRVYPPEILENLRIPPASLQRLEDRYADLLVRDVIAAGIPVIVAHTARAWIDLNRDENDVDAAMIAGMSPIGRPAPGPKQRGGLGLIPRRLYGEGDIWRHPFTPAGLTLRIEKYYRPYHEQIALSLNNMRRLFGVAILLDLHSMPPLGAPLGPPLGSRDDAAVVQCVVGDRFGRSAASRYSELVQHRLHYHGLNTALNHPYSGDHILARHGNRARNIHAVQLEVDRTTYLEPALREPGEGVGRMSAIILDIVRMLGEACSPDNIMLEYRAEKWEPVFRKKRCDNKSLEQAE